MRNKEHPNLLTRPYKTIFADLRNGNLDSCSALRKGFSELWEILMKDRDINRNRDFPYAESKFTNVLFFIRDELKQDTGKYEEAYDIMMEEYAVKSGLEENRDEIGLERREIIGGRYGSVLFPISHDTIRAERERLEDIYRRLVNCYFDFRCNLNSSKLKELWNNFTSQRGRLDRLLEDVTWRAEKYDSGALQEIQRFEEVSKKYEGSMEEILLRAEEEKTPLAVFRGVANNFFLEESVSL